MVQTNELLGNKKLLKIILFLADKPREEFTYTEIRKQTNLAKATLTKWLKYLYEENLISLRQIGLNKLYKINKDNYLVKQIKIITNLINLEFLADLSQEHHFESYLFGSAARGEDEEESDYDILIIGETKTEEIIKDISKIAKRLKKEIKLQIFTKNDWWEMRKKDPAFYERVEKDKILLQ